jgi:pantothenate kinase-related protein Tda10
MTDPTTRGKDAGQTSHQQRLTTGEGKNKTIIIGLSGPSSSGKTTIARLLKIIFSVDRRVRAFIIHEDDFYFPDDKYVASWYFLFFSILL